MNDYKIKKIIRPGSTLLFNFENSEDEHKITSVRILRNDVEICMDNGMILTLSKSKFGLLNEPISTE